MEIHELVIDMKLLERRLTRWEEKQGVLSADFYAARLSGKLARYGEFEETRADFSRWNGIHRLKPLIQYLVADEIDFGTAVDTVGSLTGVDSKEKPRNRRFQMLTA